MSAFYSDSSEASNPPAPPDNELENSLRCEVVKAQRAGIELSNNSIRAASEARLGLTKGFYKNDEEWAQRSRGIIADQLTILQDIASSPVKAKPEEPKKTSAKRKSSQKESPQRKRAKVADSEPGDEQEEKNGAAAEESSDERETTAAIKAEDGSDSDMSVLLDEAPPEKKSRRRNDSAAQRPKKSASKSTTKPKADAEIDPKQAEIKRLQGWLVKCGIRKLWSKELKPYPTPRAQIQHLKKMLADVGMTGRFSRERANQIKEARELAADIEAVQQGAERWGALKDDDGARAEKETNSPRPAARRLVRGAKNYDFLSSDGEETD
ncbi:uncharacterized protein PV07_07805 [Cladophialophora immunda]|uniref:Transcriptional regulator n=1 Tax=Cladophialophora immunda TaxID=569365 RepID=A0A0D2CAN3_9EURO|nr:uncharacterized protein PV07_07805 [Cladophialophora immunda]KIW28123.1 hypothetical protein PV07_07805 [Cladophialophora immunda]OQV00435.1 hypothetical protein CLAIMM_05929 [Cladophialophora immunda]